jgi:hypothetical protein
VLIAALAPVGLAACGSSDDSEGAAATAASAPAPQTATQTAQQPAAAKGPATVKVGRSRLGPILVDGSGHTLYLHAGQAQEIAVHLRLSELHDDLAALDDDRAPT